MKVSREAVLGFVKCVKVLPVCCPHGNKELQGTLLMSPRWEVEEYGNDGLMDDEATAAFGKIRG